MGTNCGEYLQSPTQAMGEPKCERQDCIRCAKNRREKGQCRETNIMYASTCKICKDNSKLHRRDTLKPLWKDLWKPKRQQDQQKWKSHKITHWRETKRQNERQIKYGWDRKSVWVQDNTKTQDIIMQTNRRSNTDKKNNRDTT